jgi:hypothetical protein
MNTIPILVPQRASVTLTSDQLQTINLELAIACEAAENALQHPALDPLTRAVLERRICNLRDAHAPILGAMHRMLNGG